MHPRDEQGTGRDWFRFLAQMVIPILIVLFSGLTWWTLSLERSKADKVDVAAAIENVKDEIRGDLRDIKEELRWNRKFHEESGRR